VLEEGDIAPEVEGLDCAGRTWRLSDAPGRVVLFFFPKVFTLGCTLENRYFRDHYEEVRKLGADLVGVSVDPASKVCEFAEKENIHFTLLSDQSREISRKYDVLWPVLNVDRRATFIIGAGRRIEAVIRHELRVYRHLDDVLAYLRTRR
jgi:peroxiredoxin Q/BCP